MTVKEVFDLRREGRVEEAYYAILPMYRVHHGKYTTLAMFWCAADMMNLLLIGSAWITSKHMQSAAVVVTVLVTILFLAITRSPFFCLALFCATVSTILVHRS